MYEGSYAGGGYTGDFPVNHIAGLVHGKEFVVNARATAQNRPTLEAMNRGESQGVKVEVINNAGAEIEVEQMGPNQVRIIAERAVAQRAGGVVAADVGNPNSAVSKSLRRHTQAGRQGV